MDGANHVLTNADKKHLIGDIRTIKINAGMLLNTSKDIGLAVNIGKTKYMEVGRDRCIMPLTY